MLLIRRFIFARADDPERGSALLAVIGVMAVSAIIAVTIVAMSMHSIGYTTSTRATVQARAAAEAGVDAAAALLATSACQPSYVSTTAPKYTVEVWFSADPVHADGTWIHRCPLQADAAKWLQLVSTGTAADSGLVGNSSGNVRTVEAVYPYAPTPPTAGIPVSGATIYASNQSDTSVSNLTIQKGSSTDAPIVEYLQGNFTCQPSTVVITTIMLGSGSITIQPGCTINGDVWASNGVGFPNQTFTMTGSVHSGASLTIPAGTTIVGDVYSAGSVTVAGHVSGSVTAQGSITVSGSVGGTVNPNAASTPAVPAVPKWADFPFTGSPADIAKWTMSDGTPFASTTLTTCAASDLSAAVATIAATGPNPIPTIIDTRVACGATTPVPSLTLPTDIVIIANGLNIANSANIISNSSTLRKLWLIVPDNLANNLPTCVTGATQVIGNGVTISSTAKPVAAMLYSPCPVKNNGTSWTGQLYTQSIQYNAGFTLTSYPLGLPGVNMNTGDTTPTGFPGTGVLGDRTSMRDLAGG
jgi:hypothetical protein